MMMVIKKIKEDVDEEEDIEEVYDDSEHNEVDDNRYKVVVEQKVLK